MCVENVWWRRVRPCFYRPLLPFEPYDESSLVSPGSWPAGFQHVVVDKRNSNSSMSWLVLDRIADYSLDALSHHRRRLIRKAAREFHVKRITDVAELQTSGYAPYLSFYERTRYRYRRDRTSRRHFADWAGMVTSHPKAIVLGGYDNRGLQAVSVSYPVEQTLIYATFFGHTSALKKNLGETMFHELRVAAAQQPAIREIIVRTYQGGTDHDRYYLIRGCQLLRKPARIVVAPPLLPLLQWFLPNQFARLVGNA
jgi:hypothetical protein